MLDAGLSEPLVPDGGPAIAASVRVEQHPEPDQGMDKDLISSLRAKIISDYPDVFREDVPPMSGDPFHIFLKPGITPVNCGYPRPIAKALLPALKRELDILLKTVLLSPLPSRRHG